MSIIVADRIIPKYGTATSIPALSIGGGAALSAYDRVSFESTVSGPFSDAGDATTPITGIITRLGDQVTLYLNQYTFTATSAASSPAALTLVTAIPGMYRPEIRGGLVSNVGTGYTEDASSVSTLVELSVSDVGEVVLAPSYPITTGGFCTTNGEVTIWGCHVSWPINLPAY